LRVWEDTAMMDITRNQYFLAGFVLLLLGGEFRLIDHVELNAEVSQLLFKDAAPPLAAVNGSSQMFAGSDAAVIKKNVRPPEWIGWFCLSTGAVLILHSWGMKKQGG
jgi:hypothetical protein